VFKRPSESHSVLQGRGTLQLDVEAERVAEASHEDRDLLWLRDIGAPGNGREKLLLAATDPVHLMLMSSPSGLLRIGGPKQRLTSLTKCDQVGMPWLCSKR